MKKTVTVAFRLNEDVVNNISNHLSNVLKAMNSNSGSIDDDYYTCCMRESNMSASDKEQSMQLIRDMLKQSGPAVAQRSDLDFQPHTRDDR